MAFSVTSSLGEASLKETRVALKGCTLVSSDGNSVSIIGGVHNFDDESGCNNQLGRLKVGILSNKKALSLLLQPDSGLLFRSFSSEVIWQ
jgi:hypothetical protein